MSNPTSTSPLASKEVSLELTCEYSHLDRTKSHEILCLITLRAPVCESEDEDEGRSPLDLVAVLDQSGSMRGGKLDMVKKSMNFAITQLKSEDRLSVVLFETGVETLFSLQPMTAANKQEAIDKVSAVGAKGSTALCEALCQGLEELRKGESQDQQASDQQSNEPQQQQQQQGRERVSVSSVMLFTDGRANQGKTKTDQVVEELVQRKEKLKKNCSVFSFGYGADHDVGMLRGISDAGQGMYYFVEDEEKIASAFGDCIGGLLSVAAQNLSLKVHSLNGAKIKKILGSVNSQPRKGSNSSSDTEINSTSFERELGDIYSEEEKNIVCLLEVPGVEESEWSSSEQSREVLSCELTGFDVVKKDTISVTKSTTIIESQESKKDAERSLRVDLHRNRLVTVEALNQSRRLADEGNLEEGRKVLGEAISQLKASVSQQEKLTIGLIEDLEESLTDMKDKREYRSKGAMKMAMHSRSHECERAIHSKAMYKNDKKMKMKERYEKELH